MKILEFMSFNVEWFLTTQGMLITGGVLLLLIALIILLTSGKKDKEDEDVTASIAQAAAEVSLVNQNVQEPVAVPEVPVLEPAVNTLQNNVVMNNEPTNVVNGVTDIANVSQPIEPVVPAININTEPSVEQPVVSEPVVPPVLNINSVMPEQPVSPGVEPVAVPTPEVNMPEMNINLNPVVETPVEPVVEQSTVSIYGGVSPVQNLYNTNIEQPKPVIYGGADPLENTGALPKVEIPVAHVEEVKVVEPVMQAQTFTQTAVIDNSVNNTIPAVEQSVSQPVAQEEIETLEF